MSSNVVEPPVRAAATRVPSSGPWGASLRPAKAAAPALVALAAWLVHQLLPNKQLLPMTWMDGLPGWKHPYPLTLGFLLVVSFALGLAQYPWPRLRPWARHYLPLAAGGVGVLCLWDISTAKTAWLPQPFFPGPDEVFGALIADTVYSAVTAFGAAGIPGALDALTDDRAILLVSTWHSLRLLLAGYALGVVFGFAWGVTIGWFRQARYWGMPVLKLVGPMPATALVPLVMMLSTDAFLCGTLLIAYAVWFPVTMLTSSGIANVRLSYLDVARTLGAGSRYLIFRVAIPSALPNVFIGLFMGLGASFLTLIVAETVGVKAGLGWYLQWQKGYAEYAKVYASLIIMAVFFSTLMTLLFKIRDRVLKWQRGTIRW